jgi:hypothetical protein
MPTPALRGYIVEATLQNCIPTRQAIGPAIRHWEERTAAVTWSAPRTSWRDDAKRMVIEDLGALAEMKIIRRKAVYEHRKPWNRGRVTASGWLAADETQSYFTRRGDGSCDALSNEPAQYFPTSVGSSEWPPNDLSNFLGVQVIERVPSEYRKLID